MVLDSHISCVNYLEYYFRYEYVAHVLAIWTARDMFDFSHRNDGRNLFNIDFTILLCPVYIDASAWGHTHFDSASQDNRQLVDFF